MGQVTAAELISEGQLVAGRDDMATQAEAWLRRWLDAVAASWTWPMLQAEANGLALASGTTELDLGRGNSGTGGGGIDIKVLRILDNCWVYDTARTFKQRLRIKQQLSAPTDKIGPGSSVGRPTSARLFTYEFGVFTLSFDPVPDQNYLLSIAFQGLYPWEGLEAYPWYPNDETMVQAIAFKVSEFHNGKDHPVTRAFQEQLAGLVSNDRIRYGALHGVNDSLILSPSVFPARGTSR